MEKNCISEKNWGPIHASLYITDENTIVVGGVFHDEENDKIYPGPEYQLSTVPDELVAIQQEQPNRYLNTLKWRKFITGLWKSVQDNPWFRYQ